MTRFFICLLFFFAATVQAQDVVYDHIFKNEQLPSAVYYDIVEDQNNNIWLASENGLVQYNGNEFSTYTHKDQRALTVFNLKLDHQGRLWCNNLYGQIFYVENDRLHLFYDAHDITGGQLAPFSIKKNSIQLYTRSHGIYSINTSDKKTTKISSRNVLSAATGQEITYVITYTPSVDGFRIDQLNDTDLQAIASFELNGAIAPILNVNENKILVNFKLNNENKLLAIAKDAPPLSIDLPYEIKETRIYNIKIIDQQLWFCTSDGLWLYTLEDNILIGAKQVLKSQSISNVIKDFNDNLWVTTLDNGIFIISDLKMRRYAFEDAKEKITAHCIVNDNEILIGTSSGGIYTYNSSTGLKKQHQLENANYIEYLYYDEFKNTALISGVGNDSYELDLKTGSTISHELLYNSAKSIVRLNDSILFYGNFKEALSYTQTNDGSLITNSIRQQRVKEALALDDYRLIIAFIDGTYLYDASANTLIELTYDDASIFSNSIARQEDNVWIATKSGKLLTGVRDDVGFRFRESEVSLPKTSKKSIFSNLKVDGSFLWMLSHGNLIRYRSDDKAFKKVTDNNAFGDVINSYEIKQDEIVAFSPTAVYTIPKYSVDKVFETSPITITQVDVGERMMRLDSLYQLSYSENQIQISFNSTGYGAADIMYQYKINENEKTWRTVPKGQKKIDFASLSHGTYIFKLRGKRPSSTDYQYATPLTFIISPAYWQSFWFISLLIIVLVVLVYLVMRQVQKKKNKKRRQQVEQLLMEKRLASLKLENIRSQMNPHFVFNSLNSIQDFILSNERDLASSYLVKFSRLIRMYLDYSQQDEISLNQEIHALKLYLDLEKMRFDDELEYTITMDPALDADLFKVPSLFVQPYVENALKHGLLHKKKDRQLSINCTLLKKEQLVEIVVEDNGIGRVKSSELNSMRNGTHRSFATAVNDQRAQLFKERFNKQVNITIKDLHNAGGEAIGTRVILVFPLN